MIIDLLWRWSNVPREHHKLSSELFTLDKFEGTWDQEEEVGWRRLLKLHLISM